MTILIAIAGTALTALVIPAMLALGAFVVIFMWGRGKSVPSLGLRTGPHVASNANAAPARRSSNFSAAAITSNLSHLPCFFLLGPANSGKSAILQGLQHTLSEQSHSLVSDLAAGVARWHFSRGLVLEIAGDLFTSATNGNGKAWKQLLSALQKERPQRPMDGVISRPVRPQLSRLRCGDAV